MDSVKGMIFSQDWLIAITILLAISFVFSLILYVIKKRVAPRLSKSMRVWDKSLFPALYAPAMLGIWLISGSFIAGILLSHYKILDDFLTVLPTLRRAVILLFMFWFALRYIKNLEHFVNEAAGTGKSKYDVTSMRAIAQVMRIVLFVALALLMMQTLGFPLSALLAFGGVGTFAVGYAAKDNLSNVISGMMIYMDRSFSVGDWIRSPEREMEGTVEHIGWRLTRIRTFDKRPLYVPNSTFSIVSIENPSRMLNRRIKTTIGLRYQDASKIRDLLAAIETMLRNHPAIDTTQTLMVNLIEFGPSALNFFIYTFTKTTNWVKFQAIQQEIFLTIIDIIAAHGAECAYPTTTLDLPEPLDVNLNTSAAEQDASKA